MNRRSFLTCLAALIPGLTLIKPQQEWKELAKAEIITNRYNTKSLNGTKLMSDYDLLTKWFKYPGDDAKEILARLKCQKLEDLKLQILAQNPSILGIK
jgi:hypothetical protein